MNFKFFVILAVLAAGCECARILVLYPTISVSHVMPLQSLSIALAEADHDITFVSTYPLGKKVKNYRDIRIPFDEADKEFLNEFARDPKGKGPIFMFSKLKSLVPRVVNDTLHMKEMRKLMDEEEFDLVIVGYFFMTEPILGVADHFKCPSILFSPATAFSILTQAIGNPLGTAGTPHMLVPVEKMDFVGRLKTFLITGVELAVGQYFKYIGRKLYK